MVMVLESGKELFHFLCEKFCELKLIASGKNAVESAAIELPKELIEKLGLPQAKIQLGTIQYKGGKKKILDGEVEAVVMRLYLAPLKALGIDAVIQSKITHRTDLIQNGEQPYYEYHYTSPVSEVNEQIYQLFLTIRHELWSSLGTDYINMKETAVPEWVGELPRYSHKKYETV
ncbi:hypothetical protein ACFQPF_06720 [Fictibacillus iocasae]|uniref:Uncharacterized protein n=1 Tax=Fictibacillus iocasae TaxID=2715437 RepID=A0ABW2NPZ5_9BACL